MTVTVGHITRVKGTDILIEAAPHILREVPEARFLLVGAGLPSYEPSLRQRVHELGLDGRFVFGGDRPDVPDMLEAADLFVLPSRSEGQPNALIEAMAMGLPSVATRVGGVPEVVSDGEEALLVPPEAPDALATACVSVLTSPSLGRRLGEAARSRARRERDVRAMVHRYEGLYEELLEGSA